MQEIEGDILMIYAPVVIPTLCRSKHFIRCIESLKANGWASHTEVFIALDYPAKESHWKGYREICKYLEDGNFQQFKELHIIRREKNYGASLNQTEAYRYVFEKFDRLIRTDDDIEFSPNFLEYMDKALEKYKDDEDVVLVSGYSYPIEWDISEGCTALLENISAPMWGSGYWRDKREKIQNYMAAGTLLQKFPLVIKTRKYRKLLNIAFQDYISAITAPDFNKTLLSGISDVSLRIYLALENKWVVCPVISKSRNYGFDGSGVFCQKIIKFDNRCSRTYNYSQQNIDTAQHFNLIMDTKNSVSENLKRLNKMDSPKFTTYLKNAIKLSLYLTLGREKYMKLSGKIKRF